MFERLNTLDEAFDFKLGATLKMEQKVLDILDAAIEGLEKESAAMIKRPMTPGSTR